MPCNLCGADHTRLWAEVQGARLVQCRQCGLVYSDPRPALSALAAQYEQEYVAQHEEPRLLEQRRAMYRLERAEILKRLSGGRFLDVGCGTGEFLSLMAGDFEGHGTEVSRHYVQQAREQYGLAHLHHGGLAELELDGYFDVVQMRGVLQHLPDPQEALRQACRLTRPGGWLIVSATPNIASPAARCFRGNFRLLAPDQMLYDFSPRTLQALVEQAGYEVEAFSYPYVRTPYFRWYQPLQFAYLGALLRLRQDSSGLKSPPFFRSMMTCWARRGQ